MKKILLAGIITLSILIFMDVTFIDKDINDNPATDHTDNALYIERAKTIIDGKLLYKDIITRTPPLINYLLVPPVYFGGSPLAFEIYFSFFILLTTLAIYHFLAILNKKLAYMSAISFFFIPTTLATPTFCRQDESIVVFFFILPLLILYSSGKKYAYSLISSIGVWIKMHSIFMIPPFLIKQRGKELMKHISLMAGISIIVTIPFLLLAFNEFTWYLKFYLLGEGDALEGISVWRLLAANGIKIPSILLISFMIGVIIAIYIKFYKKSLWKIVLLSIIAYFILYPKIHYEYFLMLFSIAVPYFIESRKKISLIYAISVLTSITLLIEQRYLDWKVTNYAYWFFIPLAIACMLAVDAILIYFFHDISKDSWIDKFEK
ncbi:MAG: hypothetical protein J7J36_02205 [Thermoplasmata archaeon]|nr:hypothetical protein [Thermoplasmata archaeon]